MRKLAVIFLLGYIVSQGAGAQSGATYYVSLSGNDSYSCVQAQSSSTPKRTVNSGVVCLQAGDRLYVRGGTYAEYLNNPPLASGTSWSNVVTIAAYPGEKVWLKPASDGSTTDVIGLSHHRYIVFDGINIDTTNATSQFTLGGFKLGSGGGVSADHVRYKNAEVLGNRIAGDLQTSRDIINLLAFDSTAVGFNEFINVTTHGSGGTNASYGLYISSGNNLVDGCEIYDVGFIGAQIYSTTATASNNIVRNCRIHDITQGMDTRRVGIFISGSSNLIYNNLLYNITSGTYDTRGQVGISVSGASDNVYNNTVANSVVDAYEARSGCSNCAFINNIAFGNTGGKNGLSDWGTGATQQTNLFGINPLFMNPGANNFALSPGSPAINAGTTLSVVTTDIVGASRVGSAYDIGAYRHGGGPPAPTGLHIVGP